MKEDSLVVGKATANQMHPHYSDPMKRMGKVNRILLSSLRILLFFIFCFPTLCHADANTKLLLHCDGDASTDYRIDQIGELYITNFKTMKYPATYAVEVWRIRNGFLLDTFYFETTP